MDIDYFEKHEKENSRWITKYVRATPGYLTSPFGFWLVEEDENGKTLREKYIKIPLKDLNDEQLENKKKEAGY